MCAGMQGWEPMIRMETTLGLCYRKTNLLKQGADRWLLLLQLHVSSLQWKGRVLPGAPGHTCFSTRLEQGSPEAESWVNSGWGKDWSAGTIPRDLSPARWKGVSWGHRDLHFDVPQPGLQSGPEAWH